MANDQRQVVASQRENPEQAAPSSRTNNPNKEVQSNAPPERGTFISTTITWTELQEVVNQFGIKIHVHKYNTYSPKHPLPGRAATLVAMFEVGATVHFHLICA